MTVTASVRVKSAGGLLGAPAKARVEAAAKLLRDHGFDVRRVGRAAISVSADASVFMRELGVVVERGASVHSEPVTRNKQLGDLIDLVEIASTPIHF